MKHTRSLEADASTTSQMKKNLITLDQKAHFAQSYNQYERYDTWDCVVQKG